MTDEILPPEAKDLTPEENLSTIVYQFICLNEEFTKKQFLAAAQLGEMKVLLRQFEEQINTYKNLDLKFRETLTTHIDSSIAAGAKNIGHEMGESAAQTIRSVTRSLEESVLNTTTTLVQSTEIATFLSWKFTLGVIFTAVMTSLLIVWFLIPKPTLPLSDVQIERLRIGDTTLQVMQYYTKKEKDRWRAIADKINAER